MDIFDKYMERVKEQLTCNTNFEYRREYITFEYTDDQVNDNVEYFRKCMNSGLSPYKALVFFFDALESGHPSTYLNFDM